MCVKCEIVCVWECVLCVLGTYQIGLGHYPCVILLLLLLGVCPFFRHLASISQVLPCNKGGHLPHKNPRRDANRTNYTRTHRTPNRTEPNWTELNCSAARRGLWNTWQESKDRNVVTRTHTHTLSTHTQQNVARHLTTMTTTRTRTTTKALRASCVYVSVLAG